MADITMYEARFVPQETDGDAAPQERIVRVADRDLSGGAVYYDEGTHKGWLKCRFCDAAVHHVKGHDMVAGHTDMKGASTHFRTNPGQEHSTSCGWERLKVERALRRQYGYESSSYDPDKGYRIHLNVNLADYFYNKRRLYGRDAVRRIVCHDDRLPDMEPVSVRSVDDIVTRLAGLNPDRLKKSLVVHNGFALPWQDFFVRYMRGAPDNAAGAHGRFLKLHERLKTSRAVPCLMEFNMASGAKKPAPAMIESKPVLMGRDDYNRTHYLVPRAYIDGDRAAFHEKLKHGGDRHLVLGFARTAISEQKDRVLHYLNISLQNAAQMTSCDIAQIPVKQLKK